MGFDFQERKTLLYADLFKPEENHGNSRNTTTSNNSSSSNSSSSGFTTPFGSELGSSESDVDGEFAAELSRQMAECMLHEEDEEERNPVTGFGYGLNSNDPILDRVNRTPCIKLENRFPIGDDGVWRGRRVKRGELTQNYGRYRGGRGRKGNSGSGMQAVFLGGPGSRNGSSGTGVFLPRVINDSVELKKKAGLSTVLIPTRVLEALELHFKKHSDSAGSPQHASPRDERMTPKGQGNVLTKIQKEAVDEMQTLPQEWIY